MRGFLVLVAALLLAGCAEPTPRVERDPGRYTPAETDARKETRLQERLHASIDRVNGWIRELDLGRADARDREALDKASERLRADRSDLENLRLRANQPVLRSGEADDLERETIRIEGVAEKAYRDGLAAMGKR